MGEIVGRLERKGFQLMGMKFMSVPRKLAEEHYAEHKGKEFFDGLVDFTISGPVVAMAWCGNGVVASVRKLVGTTNPLLSEPGTIRGDLGKLMQKNTEILTGGKKRRKRERT